MSDSSVTHECPGWLRDLKLSPATEQCFLKALHSSHDLLLLDEPLLVGLLSENVATVVKALVAHGAPELVVLGIGWKLKQKEPSGRQTEQEVVKKLDEVVRQLEEMAGKQNKIIQSVEELKSVCTTTIAELLTTLHLRPASVSSAPLNRIQKEVLLAYNAVSMDGWVWCVATGQYWPPSADTIKKMPYVQVCSIFQETWPFTEWTSLRLGNSLHTPVNMLPLHGGVEEAFDQLRILVLPSKAEDGGTDFKVHVLDPELLLKTVYGEYCTRKQGATNSTAWVEPPSESAAIKFKDIDKKPLKFVAGSSMRPAKRCFLVHAIWALKNAKAHGWPVGSISLTIDSFGWQSPTFISARERTALWVSLQQQMVGTGAEERSAPDLWSAGETSEQLSSGSSV